jgi:hypothetical protein
MSLGSTVSPGLCASCAHSEIIRSGRGSTFYRCKLSDTDPRFFKYPRLPVIECSGWSEKMPETSDCQAKLKPSLE